MKKTVLYIGRFQPFHLGHLDAIKQILEKENPDTILIAIGSAEDAYEENNPFTAGERFLMIWSALEEAGIPRDKYFITSIRDINNFTLWTKHVKSFLPPFNTVYTGSKIVKDLFEKYEKDIKICDLEQRLNISATIVRTKIKNNEKIDELVLPTVLQILEKINAEQRIKNSIC